MIRRLIGPLLGAFLLAGCGAPAVQPAATGAPAPTPGPCMAQIKALRLGDMSVRSLTAPGEQATDPAWSPDGQTLAFVSRRSGNADIFLINADGSEQRQLTADPADDHAPAWSPDGRTLVFASARAGASQLYTIGADGAGETRLPGAGPGADQPAWSPDGQGILYVSGEDESGNLSVRLVAAGGAQDSVVRRTENPLQYHGQHYLAPAWSPDGGRFLAVYQFRGGLWSHLNIWSFPAASEAVATLYSGGSPVDGAAWSPDGARIVYSLGGMLTIAPAVEGGADAAASTGVAGLNPSWSPDGAQIAFDTGCQP